MSTPFVCASQSQFGSRCWINHRCQWPIYSSDKFSVLAFWALVSVIATVSLAPAQVRFEDVTEESGIDWTHQNGAGAQKYLIETMGGGGAFLDFDNDGWMDIFLVDSGSHTYSPEPSLPRHALYRNNRDGAFVEVTEKAGLLGPGYGMGVAVGDFDGDGWADLYLTRFGGNTLFRNKGDGTFEDVTDLAGVSLDDWSTSAAFFDLDRDGDLDLFVALYLDWNYVKEPHCGPPPSYCSPRAYQPISSVLFRNNGNGTFSDVTQEAGLEVPGKALGVVTSDLDGDGFPDIYVANDTEANFLFRNSGKGTFDEIGVFAGAAFGIHGQSESGMGVDSGDYDGDGRMDLVVTNLDQEMNNLYTNQGSDRFMDLSMQAGAGQVAIPYSGFGAGFLDHDNDGDLDLVVLNGHVMDNVNLFRSEVTYAEPPLLLQNSEGKFSDVGKESGDIWQRPMVGRALAIGDYDNDGDSDLLFVNNGQPPVLLRNEGGDENSWLGLHLIGTQSNRDAVGALVTLTTNRRKILRERKGGVSYLAAHDPRILLGFGQEEKIVSLEIQWPSGQLQSVDPLQLRRYHTITEPD